MGQCDWLIEMMLEIQEEEQAFLFFFFVGRRRETMVSFALEIPKFEVMWSDQQDM